MSDDNLTGQKAALLVLLMAENRSITNTELKNVYGFELRRENREQLNELGYLRSTRDGQRPYVHELTDEGWARCAKSLDLESPKARAQGAALQALLQAVLRYLDRSNQSLADFALGSEGSDRSEDGDQVEDDDQAEDGDQVDAKEPSGDIVERIRGAYLDLGGRMGAWVGFAELREALPDIARDDMDKALHELELQPSVSIVPESNQKTLTAADREAALWIGGEHKHFLAIGAT